MIHFDSTPFVQALSLILDLEFLQRVKLPCLLSSFFNIVTALLLVHGHRTCVFFLCGCDALVFCLPHERLPFNKLNLLKAEEPTPSHQGTRRTHDARDSHHKHARGRGVKPVTMAVTDGPTVTLSCMKTPSTVHISTDHPLIAEY